MRGETDAPSDLAKLIAAAAAWTERDAQEFERTLTPESLTAIMRSTWTWDDRALRRDLSQLLVDLATAAAVEAGVAPGTPPAGRSLGGVLRHRNLTAATRFLATVLGPRMIADTGRPNTFELVEALLAVPFLQHLGQREHTSVLATGEWVLASPAPDWPTVDASAAHLVPLTHGGTGGGLPAVVAAMDQSGRQRERSSYFATAVLATSALVAAGDDTTTGAPLRAIADGTRTATVAVAERAGSWDPTLVKTRAVPSAAGGWALTGAKSLVPDGTTADVLLVVARTVAGPSLFEVDAHSAGVVTAEMTTLDEGRPLAQVRLDAAAGRLLGTDGAASRTIIEMIDVATIALAAEQVGAAQRCLDLSRAALASGERGEVDSRDARITSAELYLQVEAARAIVEEACRHPLAAHERGIAAVRAGIRAAQALAQVVRRTIQILDARGLSDEQPVQAIFRRSVASELLFGGPAVTHERHLERLGI